MILVGILLLAANSILGMVLISQSKSAMQTMIRKSMLDIVNSAAGLLDGDVLGALTEEDVGSPAYEDILQKLTVFQERVDIEYIYSVRQIGPECFVFTVDADPVDPGAFGEEILVTGALLEASNGKPSVDSSPAADRWGNFYSAYSPVFNSAGQVSGIVGVDFSSAWYEAAVRRHVCTIGIISVLSVVTGAVVMFLITRKVRAKFRELDKELSLLSGNVDALTEDILSKPGFRDRVREGTSSETDDVPTDADELFSLRTKIRSMQRELDLYLDYIHAQAYTDSLTGVGNTNAYQERLLLLNPQIEEQRAAFSAAVFDIDNLKTVNDCYGHLCGDRVICGAADAIAGVFGAENTFRIGGDEFLAITGCTEAEVAAKLEEIRKAIARFNAAPNHPEAALSLAMGASVFRPGKDSSFREVFVRADEAMYENKGQHHRRMPNRYERNERMYG